MAESAASLSSFAMEVQRYSSSTRRERTEADERRVAVVEGQHEQQQHKEQNDVQPPVQPAHAVGGMLGVSKHSQLSSNWQHQGSLDVQDAQDLKQQQLQEVDRQRKDDSKEHLCQ